MTSEIYVFEFTVNGDSEKYFEFVDSEDRDLAISEFVKRLSIIGVKGPVQYTIKTWVDYYNSHRLAAADEKMQRDINRYLVV